MNQVISLEDNRKNKEMDRQKAMRLMEALSGVDAALLERSEEAVAAFPFSRYGRQLAVCFAFMVLGACAIGVYSVTTLTYHSGKTNSMNFGFSYSEMENGNFESTGMEADAAAQAPMEACGEALPEGSRSDGMNSASEKSDFHKDTSGYQDILQETKQANNANQANVESNFFQDFQDDQASLTDNREKITLEAAKQMERIGGYVPGTIPAGYAFEAARGSAPANSYLDMSLCWCKGLDDIRLHITEFYAVASMPFDVYDAFEKRIVDPAKPEAYDEHLYEIPYADTVPQEYREIFDNPVFKEEDFSLELVKARMKSIADVGDTNTPRGRFSVLYDSGILVEFNGRGSAEEIWEMFQSIHPD